MHNKLEIGVYIYYFFLWDYVKDQVYVLPLPASIPQLDVVTCYKQFGTNSIIVLIFVESQRVHI